jgi:magnesium chelatase family protein
VYGIDALVVDIEVNLQPVPKKDEGLPPFTIVGLPDTAIRESRERIRAAIDNSSYFFPIQRTTVNLAPADVRKEGASFDLPIALSILARMPTWDDSTIITTSSALANYRSTVVCVPSWCTFDRARPREIAE